MADAYSSSRIDELPSLWDGMCKLVRSGLGLTAFGVNVLDLQRTTSPRITPSPSPARRSSTSCCEGSATMLVGPEGAEERVELAPGEVVARVAPEARRLFQTGSEGARLLIVGGDARCGLPGSGLVERRRVTLRGPVQRPLCSTAARKRAARTA